MASLDKIEGDLLEGAGLIVLVIVAFVLFGIYRGVKGFPDFTKLLEQFLKDVGQAVADWWGKYKPDPTHAFEGGLGPDWVRTGTAEGNWGNGIISADNPGDAAVQSYIGDAEDTGYGNGN